MDVSQRQRAEETLRLNTERLELAQEAVDAGTWDWNLVTGEAACSPRDLDLLGLPRDTGVPSFELWLSRIHPEDQQRVADLFEEALADKDRFATEYRAARPDGGWRWIASHGRIVRDEAGRAVRVVGFAFDVSERKRAEEQRELLLRELSHRVKNMLAVVQAIARQTGARADSVPGFVETFGGRLGALSATHELLTATGWHGARLPDLVRRALSSQVPREQLLVEVADLTVGAELAQNLALALHELATNAVKHGALSCAAGKVALTGGSQGGGLVLEWREAGGPTVRPPVRHGFGTTLLSRVIAYQHQGRVDLAWRPSGLVCTMRLPHGR